MKYVVRNEQDLDALLEEQCTQEHEIDGDWEWEDEKWYGCDAIILDEKGKWFDKNIVTRLSIWEGSVVQCVPVMKIKSEDKQRVKNTIQYIMENFDHIYQTMLEALLPWLIQYEATDDETGELITTVEQFHNNRLSREIAGMEAGCISHLQMNCQYQKDDMVVYSLVFTCDCADDGFEVVFWKDKVIFYLDGNTHEQIFDFAHYIDWPDCLEEGKRWCIG